MSFFNVQYTTNKAGGQEMFTSYYIEKGNLTEYLEFFGLVLFILILSFLCPSQLSSKGKKAEYM